MIYLTFMKLCYNACLNFVHFNTKGDTEWANSLASHAFICFGLLLLAYLFFNQVIYWWELRKRKREGYVIDINDDHMTENFRG